MNIESLIDHTILRPDCTGDEVKKLCAEAMEFRFAAVCISPFYVKQASSILAASGVKVATVVGFPMGYSTIPAKVEEIKRAINDGAGELDVVINISAVKDGNWNYVKNDIDSATRIAHMKGKVIKIILETTILTLEETKKICGICSDFGVDFVKTSTGYHGSGANVETIKLLKENISKSVKIKASGGISSYEEAVNLIEAGAHRLGTSSAIAIIRGQMAQ